MKLALGIIFLVGCTFLGYYFSRKYVIKREFYCDFYDFNKKIKSEISFAQKSLIEIVDKSSGRKGVFYSNICGFLNEKKDISLDKNIFSQEETDFFNSYLESLGGLDKKTQLDFLNDANEKLEKFKNDSKDEEKKYKSLYIKMGFLIGLIALIILL